MKHKSEITDHIKEVLALLEDKTLQPDIKVAILSWVADLIRQINTIESSRATLKLLMEKTFKQ